MATRQRPQPNIAGRRRGDARIRRHMRIIVIPGLVPGIHLTARSGDRGWLDPGNKCRDDNAELGRTVEVPPTTELV